jgi:hypothetical protein
MRKSAFCAMAVWLAAAHAQTIFQKAPPGVEEALRTRVDQFYTLYQEGKFRQAEALIAEESRDLYYSMNKVPVRKYRFESITWGEDFKTASVLVACQHVSPRTAAAEIMVPVIGKWKEVDGQWYMLIEPRRTTPFGPMMFADPRSAVNATPFQRPTIETITEGALKVDPEAMRFPAEGPETSHTVVITNNLAGSVTLRLEDPKLPGVELELSATELGPKSQATLRARYHPAERKLHGSYKAVLLVEPIGQRFEVELLFQ